MIDDTKMEENKKNNPQKERKKTPALSFTFSLSPPPTKNSPLANFFFLPPFILIYATGTTHPYGSGSASCCSPVRAS